MKTTIKVSLKKSPKRSLHECNMTFFKAIATIGEKNNQALDNYCTKLMKVRTHLKSGVS